MAGQHVGSASRRFSASTPGSVLRLGWSRGLPFESPQTGLSARTRAALRAWKSPRLVKTPRAPLDPESGSLLDGHFNVLLLYR